MGFVGNVRDRSFSSDFAKSSSTSFPHHFSITRVKPEKPSQTHLQRVNGERDVFAKGELEEHFIERHVYDPRIQHRFGDELPDNPDDMRAFLISVVRDVLGADRRREQAPWVEYIRAGAERIVVAPNFQIAPCKLARHERVKLERRPEARADLLKVLHFEDRGRRSVQLEHLHGALENVLPRDPDLLSLQPAQESDAVVSTRAVLEAVLLALPFEDETRISERR